MDVNINTRLSAPCGPHIHMNMIQIGSTPCFTFDLNKQIVKFEDIGQLSFIFKQGCDVLKSFNLYDENGNMDAHFRHDDILNEVIFTMKSDETLDFIATYKGGGLIDFEILVVVGDDELIFADEDSKIYVLDSLYRRTVEI